MHLSGWVLFFKDISLIFQQSVEHPHGSGNNKLVRSLLSAEMPPLVERLVLGVYIFSVIVQLALFAEDISFV